MNRNRVYDIIDTLSKIGQEHGVTAAEVALAWVRLQAGITSTIIGAKNTDQLAANIHSTTLELTGEDLKQLDEVSALPKEYPGWMVERQMADRALNGAAANTIATAYVRK